VWVWVRVHGCECVGLGMGMGVCVVCLFFVGVDMHVGTHTGVSSGIILHMTRYLIVACI